MSGRRTAPRAELKLPLATNRLRGVAEQARCHFRLPPDHEAASRELLSGAARGVISSARPLPALAGSRSSPLVCVTFDLHAVANTRGGHFHRPLTRRRERGRDRDLYDRELDWPCRQPR